MMWRASLAHWTFTNETNLRIRMAPDLVFTMHLIRCCSIQPHTQLADLVSSLPELIFILGLIIAAALQHTHTYTHISSCYKPSLLGKRLYFQLKDSILVT